MVVADVAVEDGGGVAGTPVLFLWPITGIEDDGFVEFVDEFGVAEVESLGDLLYDADGEFGFGVAEFVDVVV